MKYFCPFEHNNTGERRDLICALEADDVATVELIRSTEGEEQSRITAAAIVLRSAYSELDAFQWSHLSPPAPVN